VKEVFIFERVSIQFDSLFVNHSTQNLVLKRLVLMRFSENQIFYYKHFRIRYVAVLDHSTKLVAISKFFLNALPSLEMQRWRWSGETGGRCTGETGGRWIGGRWTVRPVDGAPSLLHP
jgi:hypothetical protein